MIACWLTLCLAAPTSIAVYKYGNQAAQGAPSGSRQQRRKGGRKVQERRHAEAAPTPHIYYDQVT